MNSNAYSNYLKNQVEGSSQTKLLVMMYDAAIRFTNDAVESVKEKKIEEAHNNIIKAENIVYELMSTLNMEAGGEVAENLARIYDFVIWHLIEANTAKDTSKLEEVVAILTPLREAWKDLAKQEIEKAKEAQKEGQGQVKPEAAPHKSINVAG